MTQSGEIKVEDENVIRIFVYVSLKYGGRIFTTSFKIFVIPKVLNGYVRGCPIIYSQTLGEILQEYMVSKIRQN